MTIYTGNPDQLWAWDDPVDVGGEIGNMQVVMSEFMILQTYWHAWSYSMLKVGKILLCTPENCIDDILSVNWAYKYDSSCLGPREILEGVSK